MDLSLTRFYADPTDRGKMLAKEGTSAAEVRLEGQNGEELIGLLGAEPAYDQDGNPLRYDGTITDMTITDMTGRVRRKERLRVLSEAVEQAKESVLITEAEPLDEPGPRVEYVNAACEEMTGYSREEMQGKTPRVLQGPVDLVAEARAVVEEFQPRAKEAGVDLTVTAEAAAMGDEEVLVLVDEGALHIVLRNLISNGIKYTEAGGEVEVRVRRGEDLAMIEVEDTGIGMDPAKTSELFEAFKQGSEGISREYEGSGLGFTLVKELLGRMNGSVEVDTEEGVGTCFTVRLPRPDEADGEA